jgi:hypothetical protein
MLDKIVKLKTAIDNIEKLWKTKIDKEMIHDLVFQHHTKVIAPLLDELDVCLSYTPNRGYEADITEYMNAILELRKICERLS